MAMMTVAHSEEINASYGNIQYSRSQLNQSRKEQKWNAIISYGISVSVAVYIHSIKSNRIV